MVLLKLAYSALKSFLFIMDKLRDEDLFILSKTLLFDMLSSFSHFKIELSLIIEEASFF